MDVTQILVSAVTLVGTGLTGFIGKVLWDRYKRRDPVTRGQAEVALATASLGIITASRDALSDDLDRLKERVDEQGLTLARHERQLNAWQTWYIDLRARWEEHRQSDEPPPGPKHTD